MTESHNRHWNNNKLINVDFHVNAVHVVLIVILSNFGQI